MIKKLSIILILWLFITPKVSAQTAPTVTQMLRISPVILETTVQPGIEQTKTITVENLLSTPLGIRTSIESFTPSDAETTVILTNTASILPWTQVQNDTLILEPKQTKTITLIFTPPTNLKAGGYYGFIFLTPFVTKPQDPTTPTVLSKIGVLVLASNGKLNYKDIQKKVTISRFTPVKTVYENTNPALTFAVQNAYFIHVNAKPFLTIDPLWGKKQTIQLSEKRILPGTMRSWENTIDIPHNHLFYKAKLAVSIGNGEQILEETYFFIVPFSLTLAGSVIGILLLSTGIYMRRKQLNNALRILLHGR